MGYFALLIAFVLFVIGIIGTFIPVMPGALVIWVGMLMYGLMTGFSELSLTFYVLQGLAVLLIQLIDYIAAALGVKRFGGSNAAIIGAAFGLLLGVIFLGPPGIIFGPFLGSLLLELVKGTQLDQALYSSFGTLIGLLGGLILKLIIEAAMILWFIIKIF